MVTLSDTTRLTFPIARAGAGAAALLAVLMCLVLPSALIETLVMRSGLPALLAAAEPPLGHTARAALALAGGVAVALLTWAALYLWIGGRKLRVRMPIFARRAAGALNVRRADAHPDAPPRAPIRADQEFAPTQFEAVIEQVLPVDLATPLATYDAQAMLPVPREPIRLPAPLARAVSSARAMPLDPGERIETFPLAHDVPPDHEHSLDSLLARLERGARARGLTRRVVV